LPPAFLETKTMKRMLPLKALRPHLYGTRRLEAGDEYEAPAEEAIAQVATRKADFVKGKKKEVAAPAAAEPSAPPAPVNEPEPERDEPVETPDSIENLRLQATQLGIDVDRRWGMARLNYEIAKARS
jgi:uncharacterized membrane protein